LSDFRAEAFFLPRGSGRRFCILHRPADEKLVRGAVLYVHPFAEEMNKCRRMAALAARAMARKGWAVLLIDLLGCGDSTESFADASWHEWLADVKAGWELLRGRFGGAPWLWGARAGALLACEASVEIEDARAALFWQPVISGRQHLTQFLRLKVAREALSGTRGSEAMQAIRATLEAGQPVEISGYELSPSVARGLDAAEFARSGGIDRVVWLEVSSSDPPSVAPASVAKIVSLRKDGIRVDQGVVAGPAFWQTVEIEECDALVVATVEALTAE